MNVRTAVFAGIYLFLVGCSSSSQLQPSTCAACPQLVYIAVAQRGANDIAVYNQLPSTGPALSTIAAPGAESFAFGLTVDVPPTLYVGEYPNTVATFDSPYKKADGAITAGINDPAALAVSSVNGSQALFVANRGANDVVIYEGDNFSSPAFTIAGLNAPDGLAFDAKGDLWIAQASSVVELVPPFAASSTPAVTITSGLNSPTGITFDSNGSMYVADKGSNAIVVYSQGSATPSVTVTSGISGPANLLFTGAGLLVPNAAGNDVAEFNLPLTASSAPVATNSSGMNQPSAITFLSTP